MQEIIQAGRTVEEAEELALAALGVDRSAVEVEILNRGRQGFLGIGGEMAEVRVTRRDAGASAQPAAADALDAADSPAADSTDDSDNGALPADAPTPASAPATTAGTPAEAAVQSVERILQYVGADVDVALRSDFDDAAGGPVIDIAGPDSGLLIGRRGNTLQSLQFIVQSIVRQQFEEEVRVSLDVEQYRQRREDSLREMADRVANRVAQTGRE